MTYELAKQLKDAGFPQVRFGRVRPFDPSEPTLSELIEACGDIFFELNSTKIKGQDVTWCAFDAEDETGKIKGFGKTPEEAVAKLWLELNKK